VVKKQLKMKEKRSSFIKPYTHLSLPEASGRLTIQDVEEDQNLFLVFF